LGFSRRGKTNSIGMAKILMGRKFLVESISIV